MRRRAILDGHKGGIGDGPAFRAFATRGRAASRAMNPARPSDPANRNGIDA